MTQPPVEGQFNVYRGSVNMMHLQNKVSLFVFICTRIFCGIAGKSNIASLFVSLFLGKIIENFAMRSCEQ